MEIFSTTTHIDIIDQLLCIIQNNPVIKIKKELEIDFGFYKRLVAESNFNKQKINFA